MDKVIFIGLYLILLVLGCINISLFIWGTYNLGLDNFEGISLCFGVAIFNVLMINDFGNDVKSKRGVK